MERGDENDEVEIPPYFLCPITLQIMKDPVTTITGITYDRHSILKWISNSNPPLCPVTNQPLNSSNDFMIIPNHTLRRLIHHWCTTATTSTASIPTPARTSSSVSDVFNESHVLKLMHVLENADVGNAVFVASLTRLEELLLVETERASVLLIMARCDVPKLMSDLLLKCLKKCLTEYVKKCLVVLTGVWSSTCSYHPTSNFKAFLDLNGVHLVQHLLSYAAARNGLDYLSVQHALLALNRVIELISFDQLQFLNNDFFSNMEKFIVIQGRQHSTTTVQVLQILIHLCSNAGNRTRIMEAGTVHALIELQLRNSPSHKRSADLVFKLLSLLCHYVEGRERFLAHPCSLALLAERLLRVSPDVDEQILEIISLISKLSGRKEVIAEMLQVGVVSKLCMAMQADCADYLKAKSRKVLRMHWSSWNGSPCISLYLLATHYRQSLGHILVGKLWIHVSEAGERTMLEIHRDYFSALKEV